MASRTKTKSARVAQAEEVADLAVRELADDPEALGVVVALVRVLARGRKSNRRRSRN